LCSFLLPAAAFSKRRQHLSEARNCRYPQRISPQGKNLQVFTFCCYFLRQEIPAISSFMACTAKSLQLFLVAGKKLLQRRHMPWRAKTCYAALQLAKGFLQLFLASNQAACARKRCRCIPKLARQELVTRQVSAAENLPALFLQCVHFFDGGPYLWEVNHIHLYHRYVVFVVHNSRANERQTDIYSLNHHDCLQPLTEQINYWGPNVYQPAIQL